LKEKVQRRKEAEAKELQQRKEWAEADEAKRVKNRQAKNQFGTMHRKGSIFKVAEEQDQQTTRKNQELADKRKVEKQLAHDLKQARAREQEKERAHTNKDNTRLSKFAKKQMVLAKKKRDQERSFHKQDLGDIKKYCQNEAQKRRKSISLRQDNVRRQMQLAKLAEDTLKEEEQIDRQMRLAEEADVKKHRADLANQRRQSMAFRRTEKERHLLLKKAEEDAIKKEQREELMFRKMEKDAIQEARQKVLSLPACLPSFLNLFFCFPSLRLLPSSIPAFLPSFLNPFLPSFLSRSLPSFLPCSIPSFLPSFLSPFLPSSIPPFLPSLISLSLSRPPPPLLP
jgi:hypothetical protein